MSGTSLDGIDIVWIHFQQKGTLWDYVIKAAETIEYPPFWKDTLQNIASQTTDEVNLLNQMYTVFLNQTLKDFIDKHHCSSLDFIASHGHTVWHQPERKFTLQIGNLPTIAKGIPCPVICDFRKADVHLGGQGAPLVPIGDHLLFSEYTYCLNLGGFSNISYQEKGIRKAFDICAVNTVLNWLSKPLGYDYDKDGIFSKKGLFREDLFDNLNTIAFYKQKPPKSLGIEWLTNEILPLLNQYDYSNEDKIRTYIYHITEQIKLALPEIKGKMLITGGGAHHPLILELLCEKLKNMEVVKPDDETVNFKEAIIFAFLGLLRLTKQNNVLASVTGDPFNHSSGTIYNDTH